MEEKVTLKLVDLFGNFTKIKCYRKLIARYEDTSGIKIDTDFGGIS